MPSVAPMSAGFKQVPAGGYLTIMSTINVTNVLAAPVKSGSGGSATVAAPAALTFNNTAPNLSTLLTVGHVLRDMGTAVVSSTRVFRKFKAVAAAAGNTQGDFAGDGSNFGNFYLEVAGDAGDVPDAAKISLLARAF